jgi:hypothetical protein
MTKNLYRFGKDYKPSKPWRFISKPQKKLHIRELRRNERRFWSAPVSSAFVSDDFGAGALSRSKQPDSTNLGFGQRCDSRGKQMTKCECLACRTGGRCAKRVAYDKGVNDTKAKVKSVLESMHAGEFFEVRWDELLKALELDSSE